MPLPSVLIVQSDSGGVFIVEDVETTPTLDEILNVDKVQKTSSTNAKRRAVDGNKIVQQLPEPMQEEEEAEEIVEEWLEEYTEEFISSDDIIIKEEEVTVEDYEFELSEEASPMPEAMRDHQYVVQTFDGNFDEDETSDNEDAPKEKRITQKHKIRQLTGKPACKYCDTIFKSKDSLKMHKCIYLECDPKNYICRICNKELSKKTFSNHLHETLDCQYCNKQFVNPRNLKSHISKSHRNERFVPPKPPPAELFVGVGCQDEEVGPVLDEATGLIIKSERKKYPRKKGRFECDLCGRIFGTCRSVKNHMDLHTNSHRFVCDTCGERYATTTGFAKHACLNKKRRRPQVDFRIFDVRHCKYCGLSFECYEDNKAHSCEFQFADDPKMFRCRFCTIYMSKNSYNKHMARHLAPDKEYICEYCNKKLSDEIGLANHLTTHTGDKPFKCGLEGCEQSFISKQLLIRHSRFHGVEIASHICEVCNKEVASKYHLKAHMKLHSDIVECQLCTGVFTCRDDLKEHYHDSHEPYPCPQCDKVFILPRYLKMHEKTHNPQEKQFKCEYCRASKSYTKIALLMNHVLKVHKDKFKTWKQDHPEIFKQETFDVVA